MTRGPTVVRQKTLIMNQRLGSGPPSGQRRLPLVVR